MRWHCLVNSEMGYERVEDDFPDRFNRNDVTRAFKGRYGSEILHVNPSSVGRDNNASENSNGRASHWGKPIDDGGFGDALVDITKGGIALLGRGLFKGGKSVARGLNNSMKELDEETKIEAEKTRLKEEELKANGGWEKYRRKQIRNERIGWHLGLGTLSCVFPALGIYIFTLGFGPYWGNKVGNSLTKNVNNSFLKWTLILTLMAPIGIPVGAITGGLVYKIVGIEYTSSD